MRTLQVELNYLARANAFIRAYCDMKGGETISIRPGVLDIGGGVPALIISLGEGLHAFSTDEARQFADATAAEFMAVYPSDDVVRLVEKMRSAAAECDTMFLKIGSEALQ